MASMRVVHVAPTPFGGRGLLGGGERYPLELARALAPHVDCELLTVGGRPGRRREPGGLTVRVLPSLGRARGHPAHPLAPTLPLALRHAGIVHTHQMRSLPSRVAAVTAGVLARPAVVTDHGLLGGDWGGRLQNLFARFLTVSRHSARTLAAPAGRVRVVYGGADPRRFSPSPAEPRSGVLFVGRITPHKGVDRLIAALPPGERLTVAGSAGHDPRPPGSGYPALLRRLAEGRDVVFTGPVPDSALPALYRGAAVAVLPSVERTCYGGHVAISELLGLSVLEAMACATPVVCSRIGGLPEVVEDGVTGFLVEPGDVAGLGERIAALTADAALGRAMGDRARDAVLARFTWEACAARCLATYSELA